MLKRLLLLLLPLLLSSSHAFGADALEITRITPQGERVPEGREIVIKFNRPVVPIGRMERAAAEIPITITPKTNCQWRWLSPDALSCQLDEKNTLKSATNYVVVIKPGIKAEDGATIAKTITHKFSTELPKVNYASFQTWKSPGTPYIQV